MDGPRLVVFLGPTLAADEARALLPAEIRPPAAQGDLYRAARERPQAIGLVDGVFHHVPAVWHKEILWALSQGIHVYGAASMGALRAAELAAFGMVGVGRVFEDYRDGRIERDDEVALLHGPAESGWLALSEPLVDLRATLEAAVAAGLLGRADAAALAAEAASWHYPERHWDRLLAARGPAGLDEHRRQALRDWLPGGRVARKRDDALAMLRVMQERCTPEQPPFEPAFVFEDSLFWLELKGAIDAEPPPLPPERRAALDRLRADPPAAEAAEAAALGWLMAAQVARAQGWEPDARALLAASRAFCARHGLADEAAVEAWLAAQGLDREALHRILYTRAQAEGLREGIGGQLDAALSDWLRWTGR